MNNNVLDIEPFRLPKSIKLANGKTYWVYNVSDGFDNYSQLRSKYSYINGVIKSNAYTFCNVHMIGMGLIYSGYEKRFSVEYDKIYPELTRLPDKLAKYIFEDKEIINYFKKRFPDYYKNFKAGKDKDAVCPNEIHNVLSWAVNKFLDVGVATYFSMRVPWETIIEDLIYNGTPVGVSGLFSGLNHMVLVVGVAYSHLEDNNEPGKCQEPDYLIIDDPYGKTYEYGKGLSGNDVWIPFNKCVSDFKPTNNPNFKMAHRFIRAENIGL